MKPLRIEVFYDDEKAVIEADTVMTIERGDSTLPMLKKVQDIIRKRYLEPNKDQEHDIRYKPIKRI